MTTWMIIKSGAIAPISEPTFDAAYRVKLTRGTSTRELVVEFAAPSSLTSVGYAEEVARRFLTDLEPPQHLQVNRDGKVQVLHGPLPPTPEEDDPPGWSRREPQRARRHTQ